MNKQEAIKELHCKKNQAENTYAPNKWSEGHKNGVCEGLKDSIKVVEQLDEPEKPVVPQFVAEWYEDNKDSFEMNIFELCVEFRNCRLDNPKLRFWFQNTLNKGIQTLVNMHQFGYEVEKEKMYVVFQVATKEYLYTNVFGELRSACVSREFVEESEEYHFTQQKLEGLNYWNNPAFEIEEVEE